MSEPLTSSEREEMRGAYGDHTKPGRCLNDLEALETRLEQAKKLQQLTLDNEIRWMRKHSEAEVERDTIHAQLEALEKQHAADLEAQQAAMLKCIREERVSKQAQLEACKKVAGEFQMAVESQGKDVAALHAQLEWCESERNAARARCEQLLEANGKLGKQLLEHSDLVNRRGGQLEALRARCEQLEQLYSHKDLDFECAEHGCKSNKLKGQGKVMSESLTHEHGDEFLHTEYCEKQIATLRGRCEQLEAALRLVTYDRCSESRVGFLVEHIKAVLENSTIGSETPAKEPA